MVQRNEKIPVPIAAVIISALLGPEASAYTQ